MKITVLSINEIEPELISFESLAGNGSGRWVGNVPPEPGATYHVEIDVDSCLSEIDAQTEDFEIGIRQVDSDIIVCGEVDSVDDDGMAYIRISEDCLIMIESGNKVVCKEERVNLRVNSKQFEISVIGS